MSEQGRLWAARRSVMDKINEANQAADVDLWEELDGKVTDIMVTWRRAKTKLPGPTGEELADQILIEAFHLPCSPDLDALAEAVEAIL